MYMYVCVGVPFIQEHPRHGEKVLCEPLDPGQSQKHDCKTRRRCSVSVGPGKEGPRKSVPMEIIRLDKIAKPSVNRQ